MERAIKRHHNLLTLSEIVNLLEIFRQSFTGHGERVTIEEACVQQHFEHALHAADAIEIGHYEASTGFQVCQVRHFFPDECKIIDGQGQVHLACDSDQVQ